MSKHSPTDSDGTTTPHSHLMAAAVLESSYRLTAAISIAARRLEGWDWLEHWAGETRSSINDLLRFVNPLATLPPGVRAAPLQEARVALAHPLSTWIQDAEPNVPVGASDSLVQMLTHAHEKLWHGLGGPPAAPWPAATLRSYYQLGVMLALDDLNAFLPYVNKHVHPFTMWWDRPTSVNGEGYLPATPSAPNQTTGHEFDVNEIPARFWGRLANERFVPDVNELFAERKNYFVDGISFAPGGWVRVMLAVLSPKRSPSVTWMWPTTKGARPRWHAVVAGRHCLTPAVIWAKNPNDQALVTLFGKMAEDKDKRIAPADVGWVPIRTLWDSEQADTRAKARQKMEKLVEPMGKLEVVSERKTGEPHCGCCRLPGIWTESDAIFGRCERK